MSDKTHRQAKSGRPKFEKLTPEFLRPTLSLRKKSRSPFEKTESVAQARETIQEIVLITRAPWGENQAVISAEKSAELERTLRDLESQLEERERYNEDLEIKLAEN